MFRMTKIRTLPPRTPAYVSKYELHDVRVPRICQLMRNLHLDELPQLFLVPLGKMSLVGPRPEMAALHARLDPEFAALRTSVRPGCSGLWQIGRSSHRLIVEAPEYDRLYVENASIRLDLWVMWRTLCSFVGTGHVSLDALPVQRPPVSRPVAVPPIGIAPIIDLRESVDRGVPVRTTSAMPIAAVADA
jgi:lipopolysaccharide/colanic/teichoic acid biosynthesis glycosyltransferase